MRSGSASASSSRLARLLVAALAVGAAPAARAKLYESQRQALERAFPEADRFERRNWVLTEAQAAELERETGAPPEGRIATLHLAFAGERLVGYASIDVHAVRTVSEALLVALTPEGTVRSVRLLAFHEPEEYRPPSRWLAQFEGAHLGPGLRLGRDVHTIAGATLTSRAATRAVRRALVLHRLLVTPQADRKE